MTKNRKKITAEKKIFFFKSKTATYLSLGLHKVCLSYRRCLQLSKEAIHPTLQNMNFYKFFLLLWVTFALLDPDPDSESGSGDTDPIESGSNPDPDPQPWWEYINHSRIHEFRNWEQGRPVLFLEIYVSNFRYSEGYNNDT